MTVNELITALTQMPGDVEVFFNTGEDLLAIGAEVVEFDPDETYGDPRMVVLYPSEE